MQIFFPAQRKKYALDFAVQAVNRALLVSLEAIEAQRLEEEKEENKS